MILMVFAIGIHVKHTWPTMHNRMQHSLCINKYAKHLLLAGSKLDHNWVDTPSASWVEIWSQLGRFGISWDDSGSQEVVFDGLYEFQGPRVRR
jgi:hypothetical protein